MQRVYRGIKNKYRLLGQICLISGISFSPYVFSLPSVESRTGQPITRSHTDPHSQVEMMTFTESNQSIENNIISNEIEITNEERTASMSLNSLSQIETLKKEVSDLRGVIELQDNEIKLLKKSQQDLYLDLDRRLGQMKTAAGPMSMPAGGGGARPIPTQAPSRPASSGPKTTVTPTQTKTINAPTAIKVQTPSTKPIITVPNATPDTKIIPNKPKKRSPQDEVSLYQEGYNQLKNKKYDEAIHSFNEYLEVFPDGEHAANAHYWLGEIQMVKWQENKEDNTLLDNANKSFSNINEKYPNHTKTGDAVLKMGIIEIEKNNPEKAKEYFNQVKTRYPGTTASRIAETKLRDTL